MVRQNLVLHHLYCAWCLHGFCRTVFGTLRPCCQTVSTFYEGDELNSTNHPPKWVAYKWKEAEMAYSYPQFLKWQSNSLLKILTLLQRNNPAGRLFHMSTILTENKYLRISKW